MKILLIHNFYRFRGGEDRYVKILDQVLTQKGHQVVHFYCDSRDILQYNLLQKLMIPFRLINSKSNNQKLRKLIQQEKPDLAIVHNLFPLFSLSLLRVLKEEKIPILKRLENYKFLCLNGLFLRNNFKTCESCKQGNFFPGIFRRCYQSSFFNSLGIAVPEFIHRRKKTVTGTSDLFLATSEFVKSKFVEAGFPEERIMVQPNFLDFHPLTQAEEPEDYMVYVGRLSKEKGLITLLKAFKGLPHIRLKILGDGPQQEELKKFVEAHEMRHVSFEGFIDGEGKREILAGAKCLIFPSQCYESFGYPIIESYACGVPVIASDIGGTRELVCHGENGYLFQVGNAQDLKEKILLLLQQDAPARMKMRNQCLERAGELFTEETGYRQLEQLFKRLIAEDS